jgi:hypothetical protein
MHIHYTIYIFIANHILKSNFYKLNILYLMINFLKQEDVKKNYDLFTLNLFFLKYLNILYKT